MKITLTPRERFALFIHLNAQQVPNRAEGRRLDRIWDALALDEVSEIARKNDGRQEVFSATEASEHEIADDSRDTLIGYLDKPMTGGLARTLGRVAGKLERNASDV